MTVTVSKPAQSGGGGTGRVLIVHYHPAVRNGLTEVMGVGKFGSETAEDGNTAIEMHRSNPSDVVIADEAMKPMSGIDLSLALKDSEKPPYVILLSESLLATVQQRSNADEVLAKQGDPDTILAAVSRGMKSKGIIRE